MRPLRFPEFRTDRLRKRQLKDVTEESRIRNGAKHTDASVMGVTKADGIVPMESRLIASNIARYKLLQNDWFAYNPMRLNIGSIARWRGHREVLVSPDYVVFKCLSEEEGIDPGYLDQFRHSHIWEDFVTERGDGSVRVRIYYNDLARLEVVLPSVAEQQKIAECLSSLDELIAAQSRKVDTLKAHKKGLMQQLFPREGETQPRLRFPEFQDTGEWDEKRFDQLANFQSGGTPSKANPAFWNGSVPWVSAKDMKQLFLEDAEDHISAAAVDDGAKLVSSGALLMLVRGMTLLKDVPICVVLREMSFNQDVKALQPIDGLDGLFLALMLTAFKDRLLEMVTVAGHGTGKLDTDELKAMALMVPIRAEQQRIASCLSSLDALMKAQTQKLEALKTHKKGLMQQLFPSLEATES